MAIEKETIKKEIALCGQIHRLIRKRSVIQSSSVPCYSIWEMTASSLVEALSSTSAVLVALQEQRFS